MKLDQYEPESRPNPNETWEQHTIRSLLQQSLKEQRHSRFWRNLWRLAWVVLFVLLIISIRSCNNESSTSSLVNLGSKNPHTALINLTGEIGSNDDRTANLRQSLIDAFDNKNVKGIIIRANSPGGSPVVSNTLFNEIRHLKSQHKNIPVYVVVEDMCASGCYYIAAAADKIYADPASMVGSIGVIGSSFDFTGLMDKLGIKRRQRIAGNNKGMGDPYSPETPEQAKIWQQMLDDIHNQFINAVKTGRGNRLKANTSDIFSGRVFTGNEAKKVGLIDGYGNIYSVARDVIKAPDLVDYTADQDLSKIISRKLGAEAQSKLQEMVKPSW